MRLQIEVREEDASPLRTLAMREHRSAREQAGYLLALKIREEVVRLSLPEPESEPAAEQVA